MNLAWVLPYEREHPLKSQWLKIESYKEHNIIQRRSCRNLGWKEIFIIYIVRKYFPDKSGILLDLKGKKNLHTERRENIVEEGMVIERPECKGKNHSGYKGPLTAQCNGKPKLRWMVGKNVKKKGQSHQGVCLNPKLRSCGFRKEEASTVVYRGRL